MGRTSDLKSELRNLRLDWSASALPVQFHISDFGFEMQDSSNFKIFLIPFQFIRQGRGVVYLSKCFDNRGAMHGNGSVRLLEVNEISRETLDVAVEDKTDEFAIPIDDRRSGIASNDVSRHHEIERRREIDLV